MEWVKVLMTPRPPVSHTRRVGKGPQLMTALFFLAGLALGAYALNPAHDL